MFKWLASFEDEEDAKAYLMQYVATIKRLGQTDKFSVKMEKDRSGVFDIHLYKK